MSCKDCESLILTLGEKGNESEIILKPVEFNSPNSLVFKSDDGAYRAIYLYSNDNLTRLARVYIENKKAILEFWADQ